MSAMHRMPSSRGFSLLELLIAITILGFILTILFSAFRLAQRSWDSAETVLDRNSQMMAGRAFLENLLTQAYPYRWKKTQQPQVTMAFSGGIGRLRLVAELPPFLGGGLQQAFLDVEREGDGANLIFRHASLRPDAIDFDPDLPDEGRVVLGRIKGVAFSYYGPDPANPLVTPDAPLQWMPEWEKANHLPKLVRIQIDADPPWPDIYAAPQLAQEGGCRWDAFYMRCM